MLSRSNLPLSPFAEMDHVKVELKKMSDSTSAPVARSTMKLVDARTRSSSGWLSKPSVEDPSSSPGRATVRPPYVYAIDEVGTASHLANARATAPSKSLTLTPGTLLRADTKYRTGVCAHFNVT